MSKERAKGTAWETLIVTQLQESGWLHAERRALHGAIDKGDIVGIPGVVIEAKAAARFDLAGWLDETQKEALNADAHVGVVWIKRPRKGRALDGYILMTPATLIGLLRDAGYGPSLGAHSALTAALA